MGEIPWESRGRNKQSKSASAKGEKRFFMGDNRLGRRRATGDIAGLGDIELDLVLLRGDGHQHPIKSRCGSTPKSKVDPTVAGYVRILRSENLSAIQSGDAHGVIGPTV